jgi:hypothetical protein
MGLFLLQSICLLKVKDMKTIPLTLTPLLLFNQSGGYFHVAVIEYFG